MYFDYKLSFRPHAQLLATKALWIGNALKSLGKTTHGIAPILLQRAVTACVLRVAYFAAETWWPGRSCKSGSSRISNCIEAHLHLFDKVTYSSARAILPVYCTTLTLALLKESGILLAKIELDKLLCTFVAYIAYLDLYYPL